MAISTVAGGGRSMCDAATAQPANRLVAGRVEAAQSKSSVVRVTSAMPDEALEFGTGHVQQAESPMPKPVTAAPTVVPNRVTKSSPQFSLADIAE